MRVQAVAVALCLCCPAMSGASPVIRQNLSVAEQYLFSAANAERARYGVQPLRWSPGLYRAASRHAWLMAERGAISHQFPGEPDLKERGAAEGLRFSEIAENVAEAPTAVLIQQAWLHSPEHRRNMLDPAVDSVAIRVVQGEGGELFAVEDFDRTVSDLSLAQQEQQVGRLLDSVSSIQVLPGAEEARKTCRMDSGYAGPRHPLFVMRFTAVKLDRLPSQLRQRLATGRYRQAEVGACPVGPSEGFSMYSIAVLLYR
ncbi:MAG: CAP domain-containing protein [Acidobacteriota bacterium]